MTMDIAERPNPNNSKNMNLWFMDSYNPITKVLCSSIQFVMRDKREALSLGNTLTPRIGLISCQQSLYHLVVFKKNQVNITILCMGIDYAHRASKP